MITQETVLARNVRRIGHLDLPGGGQISVAGKHAYVGHIANADSLGTSILDVADPRNPRVIGTIVLDDRDSHSHKARVVGDVMVVNCERNSLGRKQELLPSVKAQLAELLGREATRAELAEKLNVSESDIAKFEARTSYENGGFKTYDVSDPARPQLLAYQKTGGIGVHRFDMDANYAYITTEMKGYVGAILVIYDIRDPRKPFEVSRWWMPGQHISGGETPTWEGRAYRLHHALRFGDELWASTWRGGFRVIDVSDISKPRTVGSYNYHPPFPEPTHTVMPAAKPIGGRRIAVAIDEEEAFHSETDATARRGRPHAALWTFDVTELSNVKPLAMFEVSELDSPYSRSPGRFGSHQMHEKLEGTLVYAAWFGGGLRIVDIADPSGPREVGHFIPEPVGGRPCPQSNDVRVDDRGLIYLMDRNCGLDILEFTG
jgi:hypothetical protein